MQAHVKHRSDPSSSKQVPVENRDQLEALLTGGWQEFAKVSEAQLANLDQLVDTAGRNQISKRYYNELSKGVKMCVSGKWSFKVKNKVTGKLSRTKFNCDMARCPDCQAQYYKSLRDRISLGVSKRNSEDLLFAVCTLDVRRDLWNSKRRHKESFKLLKDYWKNLQRFIRREYGLEGFVLVLEVTQQKVAHCNIIIQSKRLAQLVKNHQSLDVSNRNKPFEWLSLCKKAGFGRECWIDAVRQKDVNKLAYYVTKLVQQQLVKEVVKSRQSPDNSIPLGMKLWHGSRGFVPPKLKNENSEWESQLQRMSVQDGKGADQFLEAQDKAQGEDCSEGDSLDASGINPHGASEAKQSGESARPVVSEQRLLSNRWMRQLHKRDEAKRQSLEYSFRTLGQRQSGGWARKRLYDRPRGLYKKARPRG